MPASGFYEWRKNGQGKQPYCIRLKGREVFAFAGLYDVWHDTKGNERASHTVITTTPNDLVAPMHNRMPVILRQQDEDVWLDKEADTARLVAYTADEMEAYLVSRAVNSPANEGAELMQSAAA